MKRIFIVFLYLWQIGALKRRKPVKIYWPHTKNGYSTTITSAIWPTSIGKITAIVPQKCLDGSKGCSQNQRGSIKHSLILGRHECSTKLGMQNFGIFCSTVNMA